MSTKPWECQRDDNWLFPLQHLLKIKTWGKEWKKKKRQNRWMGGLTMGKCRVRPRKSYNTETNYKHSKGGYGKLPLGDVYTCHGFS
jgi:hypothetical protein